MSGPGDRHPGWSAYWASEDGLEPDRADFFRYWVFNQADWDWWKFDWGADVDAINRRIGVIDATSTDLSRFQSDRGEAADVHGLAGSRWGAGGGNQLLRGSGDALCGQVGPARRADTQTFLRLYMVPGMAHCAGGPGATSFSTATRDSDPPVSDAKHDMARALEDWVEQGTAPDELIATHFRECRWRWPDNRVSTAAVRVPEGRPLQRRPRLLGQQFLLRPAETVIKWPIYQLHWLLGITAGVVLSLMGVTAPS